MKLTLDPIWGSVGQMFLHWSAGCWDSDSWDSLYSYTGAPVVGIARWSVPRIGQGHLEVKW